MNKLNQQVFPGVSHQLHVERYEGQKNIRVVFLHHGLGSCAAWQNQLPFFLEKGFGVWLYDRWGYGLSSERSALDPPWFHDDVADLAALLADETEPVVLIGHSDGGNVALSFTLQYPQKVLGLVIVAAHIYLEPKMAAGILQLQTVYNQSEAFRKGLQRVHRGKAVFEMWWRSWTNLSPGWDMREQLKQIGCPTLVIQGENDEHATVKHAQDLARSIHHSRLWIVENASHMLPQENSELFNQGVLSFLEDISREAERNHV